MQQILVVDDDLEINNLISLTLKAAGYNVRQAFKGKEALEMAKESAPDLIVLDIMMPGLSGIDLARALLAIPSTQYIPIIFVTANSSPEDQAEGFALPQAVDYICKPFDLADLTERVRHLLIRATEIRTGQTFSEKLIRQRR